MENDAWLHPLQSTNFAHANLFCLQTFQQPLLVLWVNHLFITNFPMFFLPLVLSNLEPKLYVFSTSCDCKGLTFTNIWLWCKDFKKIYTNTKKKSLSKWHFSTAQNQMTQRLALMFSFYNPAISFLLHLYRHLDIKYNNLLL